MEVKVLRKEEVRAQIEGRVQALITRLEELREEIEALSAELETPLIREQVAARKARLSGLKEEMALIQKEIDELPGRLRRAEKLFGKFEAVDLPKQWHIGYVESLPPPPVPLRRKILAITLSLCVAVVSIVLPLLFLLPYPAKEISILRKELAICWCIIAGLYVSSLILRIAWDQEKKPHSVFKGIIPVWALERYRRAKEEKIFDDIIIAAPQREAFTQLGVKADPVMIGVIGAQVKFDGYGMATVGSAGLDKAILFEIASWNIAGDILASAGS